MADIVQDVVNRISVDDNTKRAFSSISKGFDKSSKKAKAFKAGIKSALNVGAGMLFAQGFTAVTRSIQQSIVQAREFSRAMAEVSTLVDTAEVSMSAMRVQVKDIGIEFAKSGEEVSKGFYQAISSGVSGADIEAFTEVANKLAVGGVATTAQSVDLLTTALNAYGLGTEHAITVSNQLFETVKQGKTTIPELSGALGRILPLAKQAGIGMNEVLGATATLTAQGVNTAESMTLIKGIMTAVLKPTDDATNAIEELGLTLFNTKGLEKGGLIGLIRELRDKSGGSIDVIAELIPNIRGMAGAAALAGANFDVFDEKLKLITKDANQTNIAFNKMRDDMSFKMDVITNGLNEASIALTEGLMKGFSDGIGTTDDLVSSMKEINVTLENMGTIAGGVLSKLDDLAAHFSGASSRSSESILQDIQFGQQGKLLKQIGPSKKLSDSDFEEFSSARHKFAEKDTRAQGLADLMRLSDRLQSERNAKIEEEKKKQEAITKEKMKQIEIDRESVRSSREKEKSSGVIAKEIEKQRMDQEKILNAQLEQGRQIATQLGLMTDLQREQTLQLANFLKDASAGDLQGLSETARKRIRGDAFLRDTFAKRSEATGAGSELENKLENIIIRTMIVGGEKFKEVMGATAQIREVNDIEEMGTIMQANQQVAGVQA